MPIAYHTENINERFVKQTILHTLANNYIRDLTGWLKKWDIHVWDVSDTRTAYFGHIKTTSGQKINPDMPSGVTGKYRMDLYLHDSQNVFKARENGDRIMHEVCHALLIGTPDFVTGVHNNIKNRYTISYWYWDRFKYTKFYLSVIDIRKYTISNRSSD